MTVSFTLGDVLYAALVGGEPYCEHLSTRQGASHFLQ